MTALSLNDRVSMILHAHINDENVEQEHDIGYNNTNPSFCISHNAISYISIALFITDLEDQTTAASLAIA